MSEADSGPSRRRIYRQVRAAVEPLDPRLLLSDGSPDPAFGASGLALFHLRADGGGAGDGPRARRVVVVAGPVRKPNARRARLGVVKLTPAGLPDPAFAGGGKEALDLGGFVARTAAVAGGRQILVGGTVRQNFAVVRLDADGTPDPSFGVGGVAVVAVAGGASVFSLLVQPSGAVVVGGNGASPGSRRREALDPTFGVGGSTEVGFGPLRALASDASGNVLAAGRDGGGGVVAQVLPDGQFDPGYFAFTTFAPDAQKGRFDSLFVTRDGSVVAGGRKEPGDSQTDLIVVRFNPDGSADPSFGTGGVAIESRRGPAGRRGQRRRPPGRRQGRRRRHVVHARRPRGVPPLPPRPRRVARHALRQLRLHADRVRPQRPGQRQGGRAGAGAAGASRGGGRGRRLRGGPLPGGVRDVRRQPVDRQRHRRQRHHFPVGRHARGDLVGNGRRLDRDVPGEGREPGRRLRLRRERLDHRRPRRPGVGAARRQG